MRCIRVVVAAVTAIGCGADMMGGSSSGAVTMQGFRAVGSEMSAAVAQYEADTTSILDESACLATHDAYQSRMQQMVDRMAEMSGAMDGHMATYGERVPGDMACVAAVMAAELERHHAAACTAELAGDEAEAAQHVAAMTSLLDHQRLRYEGAGEMMGMMTADGGATWTCQQNADGTFTIDGQPWTPGTPLPGASADASAPWPPPCSGGSCSGCDGSGMGGGMM